MTKHFVQVVGELDNLLVLGREEAVHTAAGEAGDNER